jgi:hypothetical protein
LNLFWSRLKQTLQSNNVCVYIFCCIYRSQCVDGASDDGYKKLPNCRVSFCKMLLIKFRWLTKGWWFLLPK